MQTSVDNSWCDCIPYPGPVSVHDRQDESHGRQNTSWLCISQTHDDSCG